MPRRAVPVALLALLVAACAAPAPSPAPAPPALPPPAAVPSRDDLYVVLPGRDGAVGAITVTAERETRVLDHPYAAARIREPGMLQADTATEAQVREAFGAALAAQPPRPISFLLYFQEGQEELTAESKQLLSTILAELARRPAPEVSVVGHTDRMGSVPYNDTLSLRRAERVRSELLLLGIAAEWIQVSGRGEREPLVPTADEVAEPRNRRVEIRVR